MSVQLVGGKPERQARRVRRPQELLSALTRLDTTADEQTRRDLLGWIHQAYEARGGGILLGLFARCHLGSPFVDHRISLTWGIVEHYAAHDEVPPAFRNCRALVRSSAYAYIEVYVDGEVVPIRLDGHAAL